MSSKSLCCQVPCSSEALNKLTTFLKVWDDVEIEKIFDKYKEPTDSDPKSASLSAEKLQAALQELCIQGSPAGSTEWVDLDEFKRIARQPNEAEQWFQMIPFASLLAFSLSIKTLDKLEGLQQGYIILGLQAFSQGVQAVLERRLKKLKDQKAKLEVVPDGESKFGGFLEGGNVDDFYHGLSDRLGKY